MRKALVVASKKIESKDKTLSNIVSYASYAVSSSIHKPNEKYTGRE